MPGQCVSIPVAQVSKGRRRWHGSGSRRRAGGPWVIDRSSTPLPRGAGCGGLVRQACLDGRSTPLEAPAHRIGIPPPARRAVLVGPQPPPPARAPAGGSPDPGDQSSGGITDEAPQAAARAESGEGASRGEGLDTRQGASSPQGARSLLQISRKSRASDDPAPPQAGGGGREEVVKKRCAHSPTRICIEPEKIA